MMSKRLTVLALLAAVPLVVAAIASPEPSSLLRSALASTAAYDARSAQGVTVHEWGTFTSVAGPDGKAMDWQPAGGPSDLPCFVALTDPSSVKTWGSGPANLLGGREGVGTVRMETPVLYFYSPKETTVNVRVGFPHGIISEWYPSVAQVLPTGTGNAIKNLPLTYGTIDWKNVKIMPGAAESYPSEGGSSHYYAARRTNSNPVQVGNQKEKFLFYRGIASFQPPIAAVVNPNGTIQVTNLGSEQIPNVILFENRAGKIGYTVVREFDKQTTMELPKLTSDFASLQKSLEAILEAQGMYSDEAKAMVNTWKDTWFEQGTRIFYIVPSRTVDSILPLTIDPKPVSVARAFVGRMEVITAATESEVYSAFQTNNRPVLETYSRFLEPIMKGFYSKLSQEEWSAASGIMASIRAGYVARVTACQQARARAESAAAR